jgi:hypothetical protein
MSCTKAVVKNASWTEKLGLDAFVILVIKVVFHLFYVSGALQLTNMYGDILF